MDDFYWNRCPDGPFATLIAVAAGYLHPEWACPARLRRRARSAEDDPEIDDPEMRVFKDELREAMMHPGRLPGDELSDHVEHDYGSDVAFLEQLWRYLYGDEPPIDPGTPGASTPPEGAALLYESVRTITPVEQTGYDGQLIQVIPVGTEGIIRHTWANGARSAELVIAPWAEDYDDDDDFDDGLVDVTLTDGQYEVIPSLCQNWTPGTPSEITSPGPEP